MSSLPIVYSIRGCPTCARLIKQRDAGGVRYEERRAYLNHNCLDEAWESGGAVHIIV